MIKQKNILSGIAIFIALYMTAALGWWTYSLLKYNRAESELQLRSLEIQKELCIEKFINKHTKKPSEITSTFLSYYYKDTNFSYLIKNAFSHANYYNMDVQVDESHRNHNIHVIKIGFTPKKKTVLQIQKKLQSKQNAWLGEGIAAGLITLIIIAFMYFYLEKILKFNQQKANFMMAVTHELKTPIAAAKLAIQTVIRNKNKENQDRVLEISKQNIDRLSGLMERVLLATQFENRIPTKNEKWTSIHTVINKAIEDGQFTIGGELKKCLAESKDFFIFCDEQMLKIVFINLFTNAIKYSEENCVNVNVNSFINDGVYGVSISDEGMGIPVHERNHIFEKFYRIGDEKTRSRSGSGLGLYLVKQILQLHKASLDVTPNSPQGPNFNIVFNANDCRME